MMRKNIIFAGLLALAILGISSCKDERSAWAIPVELFPAESPSNANFAETIFKLYQEKAQTGVLVTMQKDDTDTIYDRYIISFEVDGVDTQPIINSMLAPVGDSITLAAQPADIWKSTIGPTPANQFTWGKEWNNLKGVWTGVIQDEPVRVSISDEFCKSLDRDFNYTTPASLEYRGATYLISDMGYVVTPLRRTLSDSLEVSVNRYTTLASDSIVTFRMVMEQTLSGISCSLYEMNIAGEQIVVPDTVPNPDPLTNGVKLTLTY